MSRIKTIKTVAATFAAALTLGFVVQYGEANVETERREAKSANASLPRTLMMATNGQGEAVFGVPDVVTSPLRHSENVQPVVAVDQVYTEMMVPKLGTILATPNVGCDTTLTAKREPAAVVELAVSSPCFANTDFVVQHEGMIFSAVTDRQGNAVVKVPALITNATFLVAFDNVVQASVETFVPELRKYDRAVLQWNTTDNMRLHALEGGATIGDPGHVWSASIHNAEDMRTGLHGFVVYLGTKDAEIPYQAEVYTFPSGLMNRDGNVDLQVGVGVTRGNCGREVDASTIQTNAGQILVNAVITAQMPPCESVGEVVLLSDKFADLTLAAR